MLPLLLARPTGRALRVLCLGAHADDLEIGCGGTMLELVGAGAVDCTWVVWSGTPERAAEARSAAARVLEGATGARVEVEGFRDGFFPAQWAGLKDRFEALKGGLDPDLIFTHHRADRHQDHRVIAELTWNTWRRHLILEYEVPKFEGDLHTPALYSPLAPDTVDRKVAILLECFGSQRQRSWFETETFRGLMRIRGVECASPSGYAEGFHAPKVSLAKV
jgi:LmbE family N-acetylglucosaminyl deacetylase